MRKISGLLAISLVLLLVMSSQVSAQPIYGERPNDNVPALQIQKYVSKTEIQLGEQITINVNITNWSNQTAYDLNITEPTLSEFSSERVSGISQCYYLEDQHCKYTELGPHGSISYEYTIEIKIEGNYLLEPTIVEYFDENNTKFVAQSTYFELDVFVIPPPPDTSQQWQTLRNYSLILFAIPVVLYLINKYVWRS